MEGNYGFYRQGSSILSALMSEELQEDEVWAIIKERKNQNSSKVAPSDFSSIISPRRMPTAAKMIPRSNDKVVQEPRKVRQSAPVSIPDWSKIYGNSNKKSSKNASWLDDNGHDLGDDRRVANEEDDEDDDGGSDGDMIPPHEWISRKLSRSQISSFSVCEGAGRTLKGRDLSRVRNAVLARTGFLE